MKKPTADSIKAKLDSFIQDELLNIGLYTVNPDVDFTRNRKLPAKSLADFIIKSGVSSIQGELIKYFKLSKSLASAPAFCKQRDKLDFRFFQVLFNKFSAAFQQRMKTKLGYRLIAVDGSDFLYPQNPKDTETYHKIGDKRGYNNVHLNACYDILNGIYTACSIATSSKSHERSEFVKLLNQFQNPEKCLFIADRGYESFNVLAHLIEKKAHFLIRARDIDSNSILKGLHLQEAGDEFDIDIVKVIAKSRSVLKNVTLEENASVYYIYKNYSVDFITEENPYYEMKFRVVRFKLNNGKYEAVITNLSRDEATPAQLRKLYNKRWGIETSFKTLKYSLGGYTFHSKKQNSVMQELFGKLILFNFCAFVIAFTKFKNKRDGRKYRQKINMATAIKICVTYLNEGSQILVEELLSKFLTPIRKNRSSPRGRICEQSARTFQNRPY